MHHESENLAALSLAVRESTLKRFRRVPPGEENWRLTATSMSFADLAFHLIEADEWLFRKLQEPTLLPMVGRAFTTPISVREDFSDLCARLESSGRVRTSTLLTLPDAVLEEMVPDQRYPHPVNLWWVIVRGNLEHESHHRGQLVAWLQACTSSCPGT
jgi:uncharacterized damage-inducible protein DinB